MHFSLQKKKKTEKHFFSFHGMKTSVMAVSTGARQYGHFGNWSVGILNVGSFLERCSSSAKSTPTLWSRSLSPCLTMVQQLVHADTCLHGRSKTDGFAYQQQAHWVTALWLDEGVLKSAEVDGKFKSTSGLFCSSSSNWSSNKLTNLSDVSMTECGNIFCL